MHLDRSRRNVQFMSYGLVGLSGNKALQHLSFARRKTNHPVRCRLRVPRTPLRVSSRFERTLNAVEQQSVVKGLLDKIDGTGLHRTYGERHIAMAGYDDNRQFDVPSGQFLLKLKPAHIRHPDIGDQAARPGRLVGVEKCGGRTEIIDVKRNCFQQRAKRLAHCFIVVDDKNCLFRFHYSIYTSVVGNLK